MKQRKETALIYGILDSKKAMKLKGILVQMGVRIKNISAEQCGYKVGYLLGLKEFETEDTADEKSEIIQEEVLVLKGFTNGRLDFLLREMRKANARVELKAIVTDSNKYWTLCELYEELKKEKAAMSQK